MNKKRIFILFVVILGIGLLGYLSKTLVLGKNQYNLFGKSVKGIKTQKQENVSLPSAPNLQSSLREKLDILKHEVSKLDIADIASSSPQIQKVISDLNSLKQLPSHQIKEICQNICNGL